MLGWELPPHNSGGLGVACYKLCKALAGRGCQIDFVVPYNADHDIDFMNILPTSRITPSELAQLGGGYDSKKLTNQPDGLQTVQEHYANKVQALVQTQSYDVIHAHDWLTYQAAIAAKQETSVPIVVHVHATEFDRSGEHYGNPLVHEIEQQGLLIADYIVAVSELTKNMIVREYGIPASKIQVVHNSVDLDDFKPAATQNVYNYLHHMKQYGYKVVVSTNRFTVQKGLTYFLRAAQLAVQKDPKLLFLLCGSGEQYHELIRMSAELGISQNVLFTGFIRGKALRDAYEIADMFVMPSVSEPFGISALEAVGYGDIALVSKQSGVCEIIRNMLTYDYWDVEKLAGYMLAVARHPGLHKTLQQNATQEFAGQSWAHVAQRLHLFYGHAAQKATL